MQLRNFKLSKKLVIIVCAILGIIIISSVISSNKKKAEYKKRIAEEQARIAAMQNAQVTTAVKEEIDLHAQIQASLSKKYGVAPDGFEWNYDGSLIALSDGSLTCEDVVFTYLRALSMLDFSTAERYSKDSSTIYEYKEFYGFSSQSITDYYDNFLRKQFKESLISLEVNDISDTAIFADGTEYVTVHVLALDLTDKNFWLKDRDELFETMRTYYEIENDTVKMEQYLYSYILDRYKDGSIAKKEHTVEIVLSKGNGEGWLVSNDRELTALLKYENGIDVARYITEDFNSWLLDTQLKEQSEHLQGR